jgi:hypothetical protein
VGDDHVDRLGVEALQGVKLTSTNRPCGLTIKYLRRESSARTRAGVRCQVLGVRDEGLAPVPVTYEPPPTSSIADSLDDLAGNCNRFSR